MYSFGNIIKLSQIKLSVVHCPFYEEKKKCASKIKRVNKFGALKIYFSIYGETIQWNKHIMQVCLIVSVHIEQQHNHEKY